MKQSTKITYLGIFIFVVLSALAATLLTTFAAGNAEALRRICEVWGGTVGILFPVISIWWFNARRKEE